MAAAPHAAPAGELVLATERVLYDSSLSSTASSVMGWLTADPLRRGLLVRPLHNARLPHGDVVVAAGGCRVLDEATFRAAFTAKREAVDVTLTSLTAQVIDGAPLFFRTVPLAVLQATVDHLSVVRVSGPAGEPRYVVAVVGRDPAASAVAAASTSDAARRARAQPTLQPYDAFVAVQCAQGNWGAAGFQQLLARSANSPAASREALRAALAACAAAAAAAPPRQEGEEGPEAAAAVGGAATAPPAPQVVVVVAALPPLLFGGAVAELGTALQLSLLAPRVAPGKQAPQHAKRSPAAAAAALAAAATLAVPGVEAPPPPPAAAASPAGSLAPQLPLALLREWTTEVIRGTGVWQQATRKHLLLGPEAPREEGRRTWGAQPPPAPSIGGIRLDAFVADVVGDFAEDWALPHHARSATMVAPDDPAESPSTAETVAATGIAGAPPERVPLLEALAKGYAAEMREAAGSAWACMQQLQAGTEEADEMVAAAVAAAATAGAAAEGPPVSAAAPAAMSLMLPAGRARLGIRGLVSSNLTAELLPRFAPAPEGGAAQAAQDAGAPTGTALATATLLARRAVAQRAMLRSIRVITADASVRAAASAHSRCARVAEQCAHVLNPPAPLPPPRPPLKAQLHHQLQLQRQHQLMLQQQRDGVVAGRPGPALADGAAAAAAAQVPLPNAAVAAAAFPYPAAAFGPRAAAPAATAATALAPFVPPSPLTVAAARTLKAFQAAHHYCSSAATAEFIASKRRVYVGREARLLAVGVRLPPTPPPGSPPPVCRDATRLQGAFRGDALASSEVGWVTVSQVGEGRGGGLSATALSPPTPPPPASPARTRTP